MIYCIKYAQILGSISHILTCCHLLLWHLSLEEATQWLFGAVQRQNCIRPTNKVILVALIPAAVGVLSTGLLAPPIKVLHEQA